MGKLLRLQEGRNNSDGSVTVPVRFKYKQTLDKANHFIGEGKPYSSLYEFINKGFMTLWFLHSRVQEGSVIKIVSKDGKSVKTLIL